MAVAAPPLDPNDPADAHDVALFGRLKSQQPSSLALTPAAPEDHTLLGLARERLQAVPRAPGTSGKAMHKRFTTFGIRPAGIIVA